MMNFKQSLPVYGTFLHFTPELTVDPILTDAISGNESGYLMDASKEDTDEGTELFGLQTPPQAWSVCSTPSLNIPSSGALAPLSASFPDTRLFRLSSTEFQDAEDLQTAFDDLNNSEDVVSNQYCFTGPPDRVTSRLEDFEEENGFDSGFGSLQLTPTENHSDGMCENTSPQSTPCWRRSANEELRQPLNEASLRNEDEDEGEGEGEEEEEEEEEMEMEMGSCVTNFSSRSAPRQMVGFRRCRTAEKDNSDVILGGASNPTTMQGCFYWTETRSFPQNYRHMNKGCQNSLLTHMPTAMAYSTTSIITTPVIASSSSSSSSYAFGMSKSTSSPVSHRNLNKRVVQQEASDFLSCSEGRNIGESFDDIDTFGIETDFEDSVFPPTLDRLSLPQPLTREVHRNCESFSFRRGQNSPIPGMSNRRSRSTAHTNSPTERPRKSCAPRNGGRKRNLLNFILELLTTRQTCVEWVDKSKQVFQIVNPDQLSRLWGEHKNNIKMSFDSLSRSLRLYYRPGKLERIPGIRHQYRLIQRPPESLDLLREPPYGCSSDHRRSDTPVNSSTALKQHPASHKPHL